MRGVKRYYDAISPVIDSIYKTEMRRAEAAILSRYIKGGLALDIGCGGGVHLELVASRADVIGMDISPKLASISMKRYSKPVVAADAMRLPFKSSSFDSIVSVFGAINHVKSLKKTLKDIARTLRPGGVFILTVANKWNAGWYLDLIRKGKLANLGNALKKREGMLRRSVGKEWFEVWTRFYSVGEIEKAVAEHFEIESAFGLTKNGKVYGFPFSHFTEYIGFVLQVRK